MDYRRRWGRSASNNLQQDSSVNVQSGINDFSEDEQKSNKVKRWGRATSNQTLSDNGINMQIDVPVDL